MGRVLTNTVTVSVAEETSPGVPGEAWDQLEPNSVGSVGPVLETVARDPISRHRQRVKGIVSKLEASAELEHDVTASFLSTVLGGFLFAVPTNRDLAFRSSPATASAYTVPALSAAQAARLHYESGGPVTLLHAAGYLLPGNNGLKALAAKPVAPTTALTVSGGLTAETARPQQSVELAGVRAASEDLALVVTGTEGILSSGNGAGTALDFSELGLTPGQFVHVGGVDPANRLAAGVYGYARVVSVDPAFLELDKLSSALVTSPGTGQSVDLLFGQFVRNVPVGHDDYAQRSFTFEVTYPNLGPAGETMYEYVRGCHFNELSIELAVSDKATASASFVGLDADPPTTDRAAGADAPFVPGRRGALGTASDVARLRLADTDETGLSTDFKSLTLTLNNNVEGEFVLGRLGPRYVNAGNFEVDIEAELVFTSADVLARVRSNAEVTLDFAMRNEDGAVYLDVPALTLGSGERGFAVNESVNVAIDAMAHEDPRFGVSLSASVFPVVPLE
jgi:hypothetical protein